MAKLKRNRSFLFTIIVEQAQTKRSAELALLSTFARRSPDGLKFQLLQKLTDKEAHLSGKFAGYKEMVAMVNLELDALMDKLKTFERKL